MEYSRMGEAEAEGCSRHPAYVKNSGSHHNNWISARLRKIVAAWR